MEMKIKMVNLEERERERTDADFFFFFKLKRAFTNILRKKIILYYNETQKRYKPDLFSQIKFYRFF